MKTAYFGDEHSHTYALASREAGDTTLVGYKSISSAVEALSTGQVDQVVAPIENSVGGTVGECIDSLKNNDVYITAQYVMRISHSLIAKEGTKKEDIKRIYSHPQALTQCEKYLRKNFPGVQLLPVGNTSEALQIIKEKDECAIARAPLDGQVALEEEIEDLKSNYTKFVLIRKTPVLNGKIASIMFDIYHRPGALLEVLTVLAQNNINMNKLESRPARDGEFKYWFFVEFECANGKEELLTVMQKLSEKVEFIKFLGTY